MKKREKKTTLLTMRFKSLEKSWFLFNYIFLILKKSIIIFYVE